MADGEAGSHSDGSPNSSSSDGDHEYSTELQPMTAKGIKRLCSELLEIKKASDEDFHRNVYSCYSAFLRIFEEVSQVNCDLEGLKQCVSDQRKLVQDLINSLYLEKLSDSSTETKVPDIEDLDLCSDTEFGPQVYDTLDSLDTFLSEQQVDDALILLETMAKTLQRMQMEKHLAPMILSYLCAISDRRTRLSKQYVLLAEHPRVAQPELQKALTGLCRLGEHHQANLLLVKFYHLRLENHMKELVFRKEYLGHTYLYEVAKLVFSVISQSAKSFILLYGETYPYAPELMEWARKAIEEFSHKFDAYLKSISEINGMFNLAVEAVNCAFSLCALLRSQGLFMLPDLVNCIKPCMEEVFHKHMDQCRKVASILVDNETWALNKFFLSEMLEGMASLSGDVGEEEYCLLTSSGSKFVTLIQVIVNEISSLVSFKMESPIAQGLAGLVNEYICALERAIQSEENNLEIYGQGSSSTPKLEQQLSLLVNISTLVDLFPIITAGIFSIAKPKHFPSEQAAMSLQELHHLVLSIEEAADRLRHNFCQQFVCEAMSSRPNKSKPIWELNAKNNNQCTTSSKQDHLMPSFIFQELFQWLRKVENISRSGKHGIVEKLLKELMEAVIVWLSNNQSYWKNTEDSLDTQKGGLLEQVHVDIHFLLEIARVGGYLSDNLMDAAMHVMTEIDETSTAFISDLDSVIPDDRWVKDAVRLAIEKLLNIELVEQQLKEEPASIEMLEGISPPVRDDAAGTSVDSADLQDDVYEDYAEENFLKLLEKNSADLEYLDKPIVHIEPNGVRQTSDKINSVNKTENPDVIISLMENLKICDIEGKKNNIKDPERGPDVKFICRLDTSAVLDSQSETEKQQDAAMMETMAMDTELLEVSHKMDAAPIYLSDDEVSNLVHDAEGISFYTPDGEIELELEEKLTMLQTGIISNPVVETDYISCSSEEILKEECLQ